MLSSRHGGIEIFKVADTLAPKPNKPSIPTLIPADATGAAGVVFSRSRVERIDGLANATKVVDPIVGPVSVYMVNLIRWPLSVHVKPCKPMGVMSFPVYANLGVPVGFP